MDLEDKLEGVNLLVLKMSYVTPTSIGMACNIYHLNTTI